MIHSVSHQEGLDLADRMKILYNILCSVFGNTVKYKFIAYFDCTTFQKYVTEDKTRKLRSVCFPCIILDTVFFKIFK